MPTVCTYDTEATVAENAFTRKGYVFKGWALEVGGLVRYLPGAKVKNLTAEADGGITLHAVWERDGSELEKGDYAYCVIDLSGGAEATAYPVTTRTGVPEGGFNTDEYKSTKLVLRRCPAGADPLGRYTLTKDFYAGVFEVTEKQWELVMGSNPSSYKRGDTYPVENVSYNDIRGETDGSNWPSSSAEDATSFLGKLRAKTGLPELDLPTAAQWEYTCRAGTTTTYNTGDSEAALAEAGWYSGNANNQKHPVGEKVANAWGLYDLHGNVWEWCLDWYQRGDPSGTDPVGAASGSNRRFRGGSWYCDARDAASEHRNDYGDPSGRNCCLGFRLFLTLERSAPTPDVPTVTGDPDATVTGDAEKGFVVRPSAKNENVVVEIPDSVDAAKVRVIVSPDVKTVTPNGAVVRIMRGTADITNFLDIPAAVGGVIDLGAATVKPEIEREALDPMQGAQIELSELNTQITTARTKEGIV